MSESATLDHVGINVKAYRLLEQLLGENPRLEEIMRSSKNQVEALVGVRRWVESALEDRPAARRFRESEHPSREEFEALGWSDIAAIRILDYVDHAGREFEDLNLSGERAVSNPLHDLWLAVNHGTGGAKPWFFEDMIRLFRQFSGRSQRRKPTKEHVLKWMERHPSGLDPRIVIPAVLAQQQAAKRAPGIPLISDEEAERRQREADAKRRRRAILRRVSVAVAGLALGAWLLLSLGLPSP